MCVFMHMCVYVCIPKSSFLICLHTLSLSLSTHSLSLSLYTLSLSLCLHTLSLSLSRACVCLHAHVSFRIRIGKDLFSTCLQTHALSFPLVCMGACVCVCVLGWVCFRVENSSFSMCLRAGAYVVMPNHGPV